MAARLAFSMLFPTRKVADYRAHATAPRTRASAFRPLTISSHLSKSMTRVIVVGGGLAGLSAAHTLYERGANVLLLDKNPFHGGNSTKATSGINGAGTRTQAAKGIKDTAAAFFADTKKSARELARDDLIKVLTYQSGSAVEWLMDRFNLDLAEVSRLGGHSFERTHRPAAGGTFPGMAITYAQMEAIEELAESEPERVQILKKANVKKLIKDNGAVVGVEYEFNGETRREFGAVVLATGGYAADFSDQGLLAKFRPELLGLPTTNGDHCTGDGQKMALEVGGSGIDMEKVQVHPTGLVDPKDPDAKVKFLAAEALRGCGGLLLDGEGNRFADELGHRDYVTGRIWDNGKYPVRLILNGEATKEIEWHCKHYTHRGLMKRFDTTKQVADEMGLPESKIQATFDSYMKVADGKDKDPWGKKFFHNHNWRKDAGPFHVAVMTPVLHYTMGGLEIDDHARVLDIEKRPIQGLFACGEVAGGVHGANRLGGSSLLGCVVYGRVAGNTSSAYLLSELSSAKAANRLGQVGGHLGLATTVRIDPATKKVSLDFSWADAAGESSGGPSQVAASAPAASPTEVPKAPAGAKKPAPPKKEDLKEYSLDEVAKHNSKDDCWVAVNGQVLDATKFLPDHPGGPKAILLYAGKEASEAFNMVHEKSVVQKYAADTIIGTYKE